MENKLQGWFIFGRLSRLFFSFTPKHDKNVWRPHLITSDIYCLVFVPRVLLNSAFQLWTIKVSSQQSCSLQMFSKCSEEQMQNKKKLVPFFESLTKRKMSQKFPSCHAETMDLMSFKMKLLSVFMHVIVISMWTNRISKPYLAFEHAGPNRSHYSAALTASSWFPTKLFPHRCLNLAAGICSNSDAWTLVRSNTDV